MVLRWKSLNIKVLTSLAAIFIVGGAIAITLINVEMRKEAINHATHEAKALLAQTTRIHDYFVKNLRPHLFERFAGQIDKEYFAPVWMSSGYAVRSMFRGDYGGKEMIYKITSPNARTSEYEADDYELTVIREFEKDRSLKEHVDIRSINGIQYLSVMRPGQYFTEVCLRCHSTPDVAPAGLVEIYGPERGFHRKVGELSASFMTLVPIDESISHANEVSLKLSAFLVFILGLMMLLLYYFNHRYVMRPISILKTRALEISEHEEMLGEKVETSGPVEFTELADAFNRMSSKLSQATQAREVVIAERTDELSHTQARFRIIFEDSAIGIAMVDRGGRILIANAALENMLGYESGELEGKTLSSVTHPDDIEKNIEFHEHLHGLVLDSFQLEKRYIRKDGKVIWGQLTVSRAQGQGGASLSIGIIENISKRKELEEKVTLAKEAAESANRSKSEFLANMSHEIRTPLNGLLGIIQILQGTPLNEEQAEYLEAGSNSGKSLVSIINDILDLSKIESGKMEIREETFTFGGVIQTIKGAFLNEVGRKGLVVQYVVDPALPSYIMGDSMRLRQILFNLVGNAVKFTKKGEVNVKVFPESRGRAIDRFDLCLEVSDTGIGIPKDKLGTIFDPFTQADGSHTRKHGGTGLGLSIVERLTGLMGGTIQIESEVEVGTTVCVRIPVKVGDPAVASEEAIFLVPGVVAPRLHILLAEDDPSNQFVTTRMLEKQGHTVTCAETGKDALVALEKESFDLILMDIQMPEMDGTEATKEIRKDERFKNLPIIALTAHAMAGDRERFLETGMNGYLSKPIDSEELKEVMARVLAK